MLEFFSAVCYDSGDDISIGVGIIINCGKLNKIPLHINPGLYIVSIFREDI